MARLVTSGYEIRVDASGFAALAPDGGTSGTGSSQDTTVKRTGNASLKMSAGASADYLHNITGVFDRGYFTRVYVRVDTLPSTTQAFLAHNNTHVTIDTAGQLYLNISSGLKSAAINDGNWHRVELYTKHSATQANRAWELRVDGTTISSGGNDGFNTTAYTGVAFTQGAGLVMNYDDLAINDDQGASQNSWPGAGAVLLLLPTADSAVGAGWTLGTGTAISANSASTAVKNIPPLGVADLTAGSDTKQIRNATANANSNYDATMQSYTAAGVPSGATINVVTPWVATGAPVATGAKLGTVGVVSNPAIANANLAASGTSGAFWTGIAAANYSQGWKSSQGTATNAPSVTLGTAPVMRITQVTSSTRIATVCFMGIYVDYTASSGSTYTKAGRGVENA